MADGDRMPGLTGQDRDAVLASVVSRIPYLDFMGIRFLRRGDRLTAVLPFQPHLIGNPVRPALHGGAIAGFMEAAVIVELAYAALMRSSCLADPAALPVVALPRTIDLRVDYLRPGRPCEARARARILRVGRRYASVRVEAWQADRRQPFAHATGQFLMPQADA